MWPPISVIQSGVGIEPVWQFLLSMQVLFSKPRGSGPVWGDLDISWKFGLVKLHYNQIQAIVTFFLIKTTVQMLMHVLSTSTVQWQAWSTLRRVYVPDAFRNAKLGTAKQALYKAKLFSGTFYSKLWDCVLTMEGWAQGERTASQQCSALDNSRATPTNTDTLHPYSAMRLSGIRVMMLWKGIAYCNRRATRPIFPVKWSGGARGKRRALRVKRYKWTAQG